MYTAPLAYKYPLVSYYNSAKSWCRACSLVVMNMIVCEVYQPPGVSCESRKSCSEWKKSCD
jgi:hypothetical protein